MNKKVIFYSIFALGFLTLMYFLDWIFVIGAVIFMILNQRELFPRNKK